MIGLCLVWLEMSLVWLEMSLVLPEITIGLISLYIYAYARIHTCTYIYMTLWHS
jgi:hypothetical protein